MNIFKHLFFFGIEATSIDNENTNNRNILHLNTFVFIIVHRQKVNF